MKKISLKAKKPIYLLIGFVFVFSLISGGALLYKKFTVMGASYSFFQTDWSGGASTTARATHDSNQTGWTKYYSKDALLSTSTAGQLTLAAATASTTDTATADFSAGTNSNTYVSNGSVYMLKPNGASCTADTQCTGKCCASGYCASATVGATCSTGGIIYQISGGTVYVARTADDSTAQWGCYGTTITGADSTTNGAQNTIDIVAGCSTAGIAARVCTGLSNGGYTDWYLPARDQLNTMYGLKATIGGFTNEAYMSSTENINEYACCYSLYVSFSTGGGGGGFKNSVFNVRCIRSF